jgi:hypothetical protein
VDNQSQVRKREKGGGNDFLWKCGVHAWRREGEKAPSWCTTGRGRKGGRCTDMRSSKGPSGRQWPARWRRAADGQDRGTRWGLIWGSQACEPAREGERKNGLSPVKRYRPRFKPMRIISNGFKYNSNSFKIDSVQKRSS